MISRRLRSDDFSRNVLTLLLGTTVAQAIPIAISPILTRLYTPEDLGVLSLFIAVTTVLGVISNGRYELAIMLPESEEDALNVAAVGMCIVIFTSTLLLLFVILFDKEIASLLGNAEIAPWLFLTPATVLLMGTFNALNYYSTRNKHYKDISRANMSKAVVGAAAQISIGLATSGAAGLITGQTLAAGAANVRLARRTIRERSSLRAIKIRRMRRVAYKYRDFPKFSMWSALANALSANVANILISRFYSVATLGHYALVQRVLGLPVMLIGNSVGQVFFQEASASKRNDGHLKRVFVSTLTKLSILTLPLFAGLYFAVPEIFAIVFGADWKESGEYAQILVPLFAIRFVVIPLTLANQVNMKNRFGLVANLVLLAATCGVIAYSGSSGFSIKQTLGFLSATQSCYYLIFLYLIYRHVAADATAAKPHHPRAHD